MQLLWQEKSDSYLLFLGTVVIFPLLLIIVRGSNVIYTRYFIIAIAFLLLLCSFFLAALCRQGWRGRAVFILLLAGYLAANGWQTMRLFTYGRGQYREAIRFLVEH